MSSKPTLRDIAEATGVSTASVSMILNGKSLERFSSQRVASVLAEAERIGYRTPSARCAGKQIAILSPSVSNPYHTMMISGIDAAASAAGYQTAIYNPMNILNTRFFIFFLLKKSSCFYMEIRHLPDAFLQVVLH